jgi:hypothetical protein
MIDCHLTFAFAELTRFLAASLSVISTACRGHERRELADRCVGADACGVCGVAGHHEWRGSVDRWVGVVTRACDMCGVRCMMCEPPVCA